MGAFTLSKQLRDPMIDWMEHKQFRIDLVRSDIQSLDLLKAFHLKTLGAHVLSLYRGGKLVFDRETVARCAEIEEIDQRIKALGEKLTAIYAEGYPGPQST